MLNNNFISIFCVFSVLCFVVAIQSCIASRNAVSENVCMPFIEKALAQANAEAIERAKRQAQKAFDAGADVVSNYEKIIMETNSNAHKSIYSSANDNADGIISERLCDAMCDAYAAIHAMRAAADCGVPGADGAR